MKRYSFISALQALTEIFSRDHRCTGWGSISSLLPLKYIFLHFPLFNDFSQNLVLRKYLELKSIYQNFWNLVAEKPDDARAPVLWHIPSLETKCVPCVIPMYYSSSSSSWEERFGADITHGKVLYEIQELFLMQSSANSYIFGIWPMMQYNCLLSETLALFSWAQCWYTQRNWRKTWTKIFFNSSRYLLSFFIYIFISDPPALGS